MNTKVVGRWALVLDYFLLYFSPFTYGDEQQDSSDQHRAASEEGQAGY